ncbi:MAG: hypothetical protein WCO10_01645 [bacterium]
MKTVGKGEKMKNKRRKVYQIRIPKEWDSVAGFLGASSVFSLFGSGIVFFSLCSDKSGADYSQLGLDMSFVIMFGSLVILILSLVIQRIIDDQRKGEKK